MRAIAEQINSIQPVTSIKSLLSPSNSKYILIPVFIAIVSACSFKSIYNNLDYYIPSYVEGMVSLDGMLEEQVEQRTQLLINWHRNTQLKQYAELLRIYQQDFGTQLTEERVSQHMATMESLWQPLAEKLSEEMTVLLPLLNHQQLDELFESIDDKNEDFYDEYVDLDKVELIETYIESLLDNYQNWLGDITGQQEQFIEKAAYKFHSSAHLRLQQRKEWQQSMREILYSPDDAEIKSERLRALFRTFTTEESIALTAADEANKQVIAWLTVKLVHAATAEQKDYFIAKTDDYIRIFTELAEGR